jgi:hypothetical protein
MEYYYKYVSVHYILYNSKYNADSFKKYNAAAATLKT